MTKKGKLQNIQKKHKIGKKKIGQSPNLNRGNDSSVTNSPKRKKRQKKESKVEADEYSDVEVVPTVDNQMITEDYIQYNEENSEDETKDTRKWVTEQNRKKKKSGGFQSMGLSHAVFKGVTRKGYKIPTPIQRKTIPIILDNKDVVAMARTGSGKTAAFLIPMFEKFKSHTAVTGARGLILSPTRELALQTLKFTKELGKYTGLRAAVILGGDKMDDQFAALHDNPDIIIATPGRLLHVLVEMNLKLKTVEYVVFDEADRLFEMGFQEQLHEIINRLPESRQTLLFSATLPKLLVEFAKAGLHDPTLIRLDVETKLSDMLKMSFFSCREDDKPAILVHLLQNVIDKLEQTVVFAATKHHVEYLNMILQRAGITSTVVYSSLDQTARKINIAKFQNKKSMVLLVTDIAARGIDIPLLDNVINYNFPAKAKLFVHRVGRVARAGRSGTAFSIISMDEVPFLLDLHVFLGRPLKIVPVQSTNNPDEDGLYGKVPQSVIDDMEENLRIWHEESTDMKNMVKVCSNAMKQYIRSRPAPATESIKRFKEMNRDGILLGNHPIFGQTNNKVEAERSNLLNALKSYKSNATVFEINSTAKNKGFDVMKKKRQFHQRVVQQRCERIEEKRSKLSDQLQNREVSGCQHEDADEIDLQNTFSVMIGSKRKQSDYNNVFQSKKKKLRKLEIRDEENYLSYRPADYQSERGYSLGTSFDQEVASASLDLTGDEENHLRKMKSQMKWDRKKKKFVQDSIQDPKKKKIRTESGAYISASYKSNAYKDWKNRNKIGEAEEDSEDDSGKQQKKSVLKKRLSVLGSKGKRWHTKGMDNEPNKSEKRKKFRPAKSELKRPEQILKSRKIKAKKQAFQKQRQKIHQKRRNFSAQKAKKNR